jgi:hypothetical protein
VKLASSLAVAQDPPQTLPPLAENDPFFDKEFLADLQKLREASAKEGEKAQQTMTSIQNASAEEEMPYYLKYFFDQWTEDDIDTAYVLSI